MKQLFGKILPNFVLRFLAKQKYKAYNIATHQENLKKNHVVTIVCKNIKKYSLLKSMLYRSFGGTIEVDNRLLYFHPIAIIKTPDSMETYLKEIGAKSRNMNKKALKKGINTKLFDWNERLDDLYAIHTSAKKRQGREMDKAYLAYPKRVENRDEKDFSVVYIGAFFEKHLVGYIEVYRYGNFTMTNRILGHKDYLTYGVMNILMKAYVAYAIEHGITYLNYLTMQNRKNNPLSAFKYRVGFREYSLKVLS